MSTGLASSARAPHDHLVHFYSEDHEVDDAVAAHLGEGLRDDAAVIVIATIARRRAVEARMLDDGVRVDDARRSGRYVALDAANALSGFMVDERPDPRRFEQVVGGVIADANQTGRPVRAFGEMVALLWEQGSVARPSSSRSCGTTSPGSTSSRCTAPTPWHPSPRVTTCTRPATCAPSTLSSGRPRPRHTSRARRRVPSGDPRCSSPHLARWETPGTSSQTPSTPGASTA